MLSTFGPINPLFSIFKPLKVKTPTQTLTLTLAMATLSSPDNRRPTCPSCSKPTRVCFCNRFKTPVLDNSIAVTLLQHRLEKKHPPKFSQDCNFRSQECQSCLCFRCCFTSPL
ncbi:putative DTW domain-containing protein DTWD2/YfiP [Helianthus anomalus]